MSSKKANGKIWLNDIYVIITLIIPSFTYAIEVFRNFNVFNILKKNRQKKLKYEKKIINLMEVKLFN